MLAFSPKSPAAQDITATQCPFPEIMNSENISSLNRKYGKYGGQEVLSYRYCPPTQLRRGPIMTTAKSIESYIHYLVCLVEQRSTPLVKHYNNGQTLIVIFPDGTEQVWYPLK